ncbi:MAG: cation diffusion facilitator family transporter [Chitinophagales bacterium]
MITVTPTVKAAWVSVLSNTTLVIAKVIVGITIGSVSVISEAIHSGNDLLASIIALFAVKTSSKPPDERHNYGHGKVENISGTIEALLIFIAAIMIIKEAVEKLMGSGELLTVNWGIGVMGLSACLNLAVSAYLMKIARQEHSIALEADAMHLRTDVYTSFGVMAGLVLIKITGLAILDPLVAMMVALLIVKAAYELTRKAFVPLMDTSLSSEEVTALKVVMEKCIEEYEDIEYHDLRTRRSGKECHIDFHLVANPHRSIAEIHRLCDQLEEQIGSEFPHSYVMVHVEPNGLIQQD